MLELNRVDQLAEEKVQLICVWWICVWWDTCNFASSFVESIFATLYFFCLPELRIDRKTHN
jgi:hypothetical protein